MNEIYIWIKNIVIYMIMNTIIMNLLGNKSYKKYISIVSGMILVLIVVSPLMNYMGMEDKLDYFLQTNDFAIETSDFQNEVNQVEKKQSEAILEEYMSKIKEKVKELLDEEDVNLESFEVCVDQDVNSSTFGKVLEMKISATMEPGEGENQDSNRFIDEIEISKIGTDEPESTTGKVPSPMEIKIKSKLADFYNMEPDNINISIQGIVPG